MKKGRYLLGLCYGIIQLISLRLKKSIVRHLSSNEIICIYFHNPSIKKFEKIVRYFKKNGLNFVSETDVIDYLYNNKNIKGGIWVTFDDGWKSNKHLIPILVKYNIPITIFLATHAIQNLNYFWSSVYPLKYGKRVGDEFHSLSYQSKIQIIRDLEKQFASSEINEVLTEEDIKVLSDNPLISWGSHTHNHISVNNCTDDELNHELNANLEIIKRLTGKRVNSFSFPYGQHNLDEFKILNAHGIKIGVTIEGKKINKKSNTFYLPRFGISDYSILENYCRIFEC